jgi:hypothetical protein
MEFSTDGAVTNWRRDGQLRQDVAREVVALAVAFG